MVSVRCPATKPDGRPCNHHLFECSEESHVERFRCPYCKSTVTYKNRKIILLQGPVKGR